MGLILTGDQKLADGILQNAFERARSAVSGREKQLSELDVFKLGFDAFDDAVHRKGVVVLLPRTVARDGSLSDKVNQLSYVERVSISLLLIEKMRPKDAAALSGRPQSLLHDSLSRALIKLDDKREA